MESRQYKDWKLSTIKNYEVDDLNKINFLKFISTLKKQKKIFLELGIVIKNF